jgi:dTDP-4-dehydrorhamnose 3,5-epimerase
MMYIATPLRGAYVVDIERLVDKRGFFARTFCADEFVANDLAPGLAQCSISYNAREGTLRGMHFQKPPHEEDKLIRCTAGAIFDAIVDIRRDSPTFGRWYGEELTAVNRRALYVPKGFAHGFITLAPETEVFYMISVPFSPASGCGFRWDDPDVAISWPRKPEFIASRDAKYPMLAELQACSDDHR